MMPPASRRTRSSSCVSAGKSRAQNSCHKKDPLALLLLLLPPSSLLLLLLGENARASDVQVAAREAASATERKLRGRMDGRRVVE